jgi:hypothetical protein
MLNPAPDRGNDKRLCEARRERDQGKPDMAKKKPAPRKPAVKKAVAKKATAKKPAARPKSPRKPAAVPATAPPVADASAALQGLGFFRGAYNWEADREVPCLGERVRILVDHTGGVVAPVQVRALELLLETEAPLRPLALRAAYEWLLNWMEAYRKRHPDFKGKPVGERAFNRACSVSEVVFQSPGKSEQPPRFQANVYWGEDDGHAWAVSFERQRDGWALAGCERV